MKQLSILITVLISLGFSSVCLGAVHKSLKVPNYKNIQLIVDPITENNVGITSAKIKLATKLRLLRNGIKTVSDSNPVLFVDIQVIDVIVGTRDKGVAYSIRITLEKFEGLASYSDLMTSQGGIGLDDDYKTFEEDFLNYLDKFILDYLESNME